MTDHLVISIFKRPCCYIACACIWTVLLDPFSTSCQLLSKQNPSEICKGQGKGEKVCNSLMTKWLARTHTHTSITYDMPEFTITTCVPSEIKPVNKELHQSKPLSTWHSSWTKWCSIATFDQYSYAWMRGFGGMRNKLNTSTGLWTW